MEKVGIALFASGSGTNAMRLAEHFRDHRTIEIRCIVCNNPKAEVLEKATKAGIPTELFTNQEFESPERLIDMLTNYRVNWIVLAGFLRKISSDLIKYFPERILNIHPALLPKFGGKGMYGRYVHEAVVAAGEKESGITVHIVDEEFDRGKIIEQQKVTILPEDTPETVALKVQLLEHRFFSEIVERAITDTRYV